MPLLEKYDLHIFEICKSAESLSEELATTWLNRYCVNEEAKCREIVEYFYNYDERKSHARTINRKKGKELGLNIKCTEDIEGLSDLVRSLYNQYLLWFDKTAFCKLFENSKGISWSRQIQPIAVKVPTDIKSK